MRHSVFLNWGLGSGLLLASLSGSAQHAPDTSPEVETEAAPSPPETAATDHRQLPHAEQIARRKTNLAKNGSHGELCRRAASKQGRFADEQRKHIRRMAQIRRLIRVAIDKGDHTSAAVIRQLQKKEMNRHSVVMRERNEHIRKRALKRAGRKTETTR